MKTIETTILNPLGLHLRSASSFVQVAARYSSKIMVATATVPAVDGKSILGLATLGAVAGTVLIISAEGPDEDDALEELTALVQARFNEE